MTDVDSGKVRSGAQLQIETPVIEDDEQLALDHQSSVIAR